MRLVQLTDEDLKVVGSLIDDIVDRYSSVEDPEFLAASTPYAQELPRPLREQINSFRLREADGVLVVRGYPVDDIAVGPSPAHWKECDHGRRTLREEVYFFLCSSLLGEPIGWATQQDGRLMHDIAPVKEHEDEQLGSGSRTELTWHTEDAFHPLRTDYLGLMCMRNPAGVPTTFAAVSDLTLPEEVVARLRQQRFPIRPDQSHLPQNAGGSHPLDAVARRLLERSYEWVMALDERPERVAVLFGDERAPYLRIDPFFMEDVRSDREAADALDRIISEVDRVMGGYALRSGEIIFLDNYQVVHGRPPFTARFDGTDRWLKRLNIVRDLRKSRERRKTGAARVIY